MVVTEKFDRVNRRRSLLKSETMQQRDDNNEMPTSVENSTNGSESNVGKRRTAIAIIVIYLIVVLVSCALLIQAYITQKPAFELPLYSSFKSAQSQLLAYFAMLILFIGIFTVSIAPTISEFTNGMSKKISYISALIGILLTFGSFWLFYTSYRLEQQWWWYFSILSVGIAYIFINIAKLADTEQRIFRKILNVVGYILLFISLIFQVLNNP